MKMKTFEQVIHANAAHIQSIIDFNADTDQLLFLDFTANNVELTNETLADTEMFSRWVDQQLVKHQARYGIGGYNEHRTIYARSAHFDTEEEPRRLHLGVDIWAPAGTAICNFYEARVHSFANNNHFGDYGATIVLAYEMAGYTFHALYGHLSLESLNGLKEGDFIAAGSKFATLGVKEENGNWPPHLHFQMIRDMGKWKGDYPGVCRFSEREEYLENCPDPNIILALHLHHMGSD
ncbi:peptidoglycan DD-metalloendopeptidase family protein [Pedobacter sp. MR22-3]|uniref:peptidoglycan DD-metalloendopeptidase family protein n=1 Tax=Pedobacter sp. MR22-3 TaxID=2994552 RepID=UPI0022465CA7|nr:peptidoglycan DD-metalloendopeptidase family protein [Pedobacter sp. MR22-3]MCX2582233.1 peptidoglycan DD-metalloendopeptidase family protein [Pedobacter sp. MR22-3]